MCITKIHHIIYLLPSSTEIHFTFFQVAELFQEHHKNVSLTLSHQVGQMGLLERENASILNECLKPLCAKTLSAFSKALQDLNLQCPLFLTQNDGTVVR